MLFGAQRRRPRGLRGMAQWIRRALTPETTDYQAWLQRYDTLGNEDLAAIRAHIGSLPRKPLLSLLLPVCGAPPSLLLKTIGSVVAQLYPDWELCVAVTHPAMAATLREHVSSDHRVKIVISPQVEIGRAHV